MFNRPDEHFANRAQVASGGRSLPPVIRTEDSEYITGGTYVPPLAKFAMSSAISETEIMSNTRGLLTGLRTGLDRLAIRDTRVLVAVSGGADSVALLLELHELRHERGLEVLAAHFDHRLRGTESTADAEWVRQLGQRLGLTVFVGQAAGYASGLAPGGKVPEEAARDERYRFLQQTAELASAPMIATAHTADDQAETVLHHIFRGTSWAGLQGIPRQRPLGDGIRVVRPLLDVSRLEVLSYLSDRQQDFRQDSTNESREPTRNWLRLELLPLLRQELNPQVDQAICRLADLATETAEAWRQLADEALDEALLIAASTNARMRTEPLSTRPRHLIREVFVRLWIRSGWSRQAMGFEHWDRLADLVQHEGAITLPGDCQARHRHGELVLTWPVES